MTLDSPRSPGCSGSRAVRIRTIGDRRRSGPVNNNEDLPTTTSAGPLQAQSIRVRDIPERVERLHNVSAIAGAEAIAGD